MAGADEMQPFRSLIAHLADKGEALLSTVVETTPECIKVVGRDGTLLFMNSAGLRMVGAKDARAVQGSCIFDVIVPEHRATWTANHNRVCDGERLNWEFDILDAAGVRRNMETHAVPLKLEDGSSAQLAITREITQRKAGERKLQVSEDRTRGLLESIPAAVYTTDMGGNITFFNEAAVEFTGHRPMPGQKYCVSWKLYTLDGEPMGHDECPMAITLKEQRPVHGVEAILERPDGTRRAFKAFPTPLVDEAGVMFGAINMLIDTTDAYEADKYSAYLAAIVASSDDAIVSKTLDGRVTSWNAGAERIFGYKAEEMIGQHITRIIPPELRSEEDQILSRLRSGQRIDHFDTVRVTKDGQRVDVSISVSPVRGLSGRLIGASKVARDISQRKRSENLRNLLVEELNHRVKNTLATVQAIANQTLRHASDASTFAASFTGRLQSLARTHTLLTQNTWQGADLMPLLRDQLLVDADDQRVTLSGPTVVLDPQAALHLALVMHELATNARKYGALSTEDGRVTVRWTVEAQAGQVLSLEWREEGGPPVSAPAKRGFGTTLIEQSLRARGGEAVLSFTAQGVACQLKLPLADAKPNALLIALGHEESNKWAKSHSTGAKSDLKGKRLIVIEDEPLIAMDLAACLRDLGCEVVGSATTIEAARHLLDTASFDAALMDANLCGESVGELAATLTRSKTPFAFVTGYGREGLPPAFQHAPLINKPVGIEQLRVVISQLLSPPSATVLTYKKG